VEKNGNYEVRFAVLLLLAVEVVSMQRRRMKRRMMKLRRIDVDDFVVVDDDFGIL
jgi:hypothetical protein